jgi:hypothetical protein
MTPNPGGPHPARHYPRCLWMTQKKARWRVAPLRAHKASSRVMPWYWVSLIVAG